MASTTQVQAEKFIELTGMVDLQTKVMTSLSEKLEQSNKLLEAAVVKFDGAIEVLQNSIGANESMVERVNLATEALIKIHNQAVQTWASERENR